MIVQNTNGVRLHAEILTLSSWRKFYPCRSIFLHIHKEFRVKSERPLKYVRMCLFTAYVRFIIYFLKYSLTQKCGQHRKEEAKTVSLRTRQKGTGPFLSLYSPCSFFLSLSLYPCLFFPIFFIIARTQNMPHSRRHAPKFPVSILLCIVAHTNTQISTRNRDFVIT